MSESVPILSWFPKTVTPRHEWLVEEGSKEDNIEVSVFRESHSEQPLLPKKIALSDEVQQLCIDVMQVIITNFQVFFETQQPLLNGKIGDIPVDASHSIQTTVRRMTLELEAKKKPKLKRITALYQEKIRRLEVGGKLLERFFVENAVFRSDTTQEDLIQWVADCAYSIFRIQIQGPIPEVGVLKGLVNRYFKELKPNEGRLSRFYKYRKAGFSVVSEPRVGDTVWLDGKCGFKQGIVRERVIESGTGKKGKTRVHTLFELGHEEAIFLRKDAD